MVVDFFVCWLEWFGTDRKVLGIVVFPPLFLGQPFYRNFIGQLFSTDGCCGYDLVQKPFSSIISHIHLGWFKVLPITAFQVDAAPTWYVMQVLGGKGFWWRWLTLVLFMWNAFDKRCTELVFCFCEFDYDWPLFVVSFWKLNSLGPM